MLLNRILFLSLLTGFFAGCSTKKNTVVSRAYHNLTARYNGYYYSNESISDGVYKIEKANKDNFDKILPVYIYPGPDKVKNTFPEFDKAIKKSSLCIQKHAIKDGNGNEVPTAGKWIDNNWINIGVSHFYKREFFSGMESFEYVARTYNKSKDKYEAILWLIKTNNEIGSVTSSESFISLLKNQKDLPHRIKNEFPVAVADYYMRRGQWSEAIAKLMEASRNSTPLLGIERKKRARYNFIIAQLLEQQKDNKRAITYYKKTIALKPNYDMVFYSKIRVAKLLDPKNGNSHKTKKDLLKMSKEFKNNEYYDVIFYTLGEIEEREKNTEKAIYYYKRAVQTSVNNANQKALAYLKLGEINFDLTNYEPAGAYYDSAVVTLPNDHPDYERILARKKTLEALVGHIKTITREDSLQRIAKMSSSDRQLYIDKMIIRLKQEEERKQRELEAEKRRLEAASTQPPPLSGPAPPGFSGQSATFYFYNPNTVALGVAEFNKKWGMRKLEDNWRRINKTLSVEETESKEPDSLNPAKNSKLSVVKSRDYYTKDLPLNDSLLTGSHNKIIRAYYQMGAIYKEELNNTKKAILALEELNRRYPANKYELNSYYMLYRSFQSEKNEPKAEFYKKKIISEYPKSEFALLINDPNYAQQLSTQKGEAENFYSQTYLSYQAGNYPQSLAQSNEGLKKYGKNEYQPKFEFIKAMSLGKLYGADTLEYSLKALVTKHPESEVTPLSNDILLSIKKMKNPELYNTSNNSKSPKDTFAVNMDVEHFVVVFTPDNTKKADAFKTNLGAFNGVYYGAKKFTVNSTLFGASNQMIVIKSFPSAKDAVNYCENVMADPDMFNETIKKEEVMIFSILPDNMQLLYKKKNLESYRLFHDDNYKKLSSKN